MKAERRILGAFLLVVATATFAAPQSQSPDEHTLAAAHIASDGPALLAYFKMRTVSDADRQRIVGLIRQLGDSAFAVRERASAELIAVGLPAVGLLRQGQLDSDVEIARRCQKCLAQIERVPSSSLSVAAARLIAMRRPPGTIAALLAYLPLADDDAVADEIRESLALITLAEGPDPLLESALDDPLPVRRGAAAEALIRSRKQSALVASRKALADRNLDVRLRAAVAFVVHAREKQSVPGMIALLGELPQSSGWRVEEILVLLAGDDAPKVSLGSDEASRHKCRDAWLVWWGKHGPATDLAKLDGAPPVLGVTLLVLREQRTIVGRVLEINSAREVVWKIEGLQNPIDAVVSGKDRVLIAEQGNQPEFQRISERDFEGKILWSKQVSMAMGVQRLPNGNTLAVSRNQIAEWDVNRNVLWTYDRPQRYDITAARKLKNGDTVFLTNQGECTRLDVNRKEVKTFSLGANQRFAFGGIDELPNGSLLATTQSSVAEYDREGQLRWSAAVTRPMSVQRLANGNTLVANSGASNAIELGRDGQTAWEYRPKEAVFVYRARRR